jgi:FkbM family methyltransferase
MRLRKKITPKDPLAALKNADVWRKTEVERAIMTISCRDADYIPKVKDAGKIKEVDGHKVQVMHNGVLVRAGGYYGEWMVDIIKSLKGHHEPQEEKLFYEVTRRLGKAPTMIELGSFWSFYTIWLLKEFKKGRAIACEPDPANLKLGKANAELNGVADRVTFVRSAAGQEDGRTIQLPVDADQSKHYDVDIRSVDALLEEHNIDKLDILHMDVQGSEFAALHGAVESFKAKKVRFVFVSTHHYVFSDDPMMHQRCKQFLIDSGAHIVASHTIAESFSGDGLIVASFDERDQDLHIDMSLNSTDDSLFRPYEEDLALMRAQIRDGA